MIAVALSCNQVLSVMIVPCYSFRMAPSLDSFYVHASPVIRSSLMCVGEYVHNSSDFVVIYASVLLAKPLSSFASEKLSNAKKHSPNWQYVIEK